MQKSKSKKAKDVSLPCKKVEVKLDSLFDVEKALSTSKDSASAVGHLLVLGWMQNKKVMVKSFWPWYIALLYPKQNY